MGELSTTVPAGVGEDFGPLYLLWRLLISVRFTLLLIGLLALFSLLGVVIPQLPPEMRGNSAATAAWLAFQRGKFGLFTDLMNRLGLFSVFASLWFAALLALLAVSVTVCTISRWAPTWRNVFHPRERVPDDFFERGQSAVVLPVPDVGAFAAELRRRRYRVSLHHQADATYVFADRFPWAQLATFVSHLALILFIAGGLVTILTSRQEQLFIAEGQTKPVFGLRDQNHMQIYVEEAIGRFDERGAPRDYRTSLVLYKSGRKVARGVTTVNNPLKYGGFKFHQVGYFGDGVALRVKDAGSGRALYDEVIALQDRIAAPRIIVRDSQGAVLVDDTIVPTDIVAGVSGAVVGPLGTERSFWVGIKQGSADEGWQLVVLDTSDPSDQGRILRQGEQADLRGVSMAFEAVVTLPSATLSGLPGAEASTVAELADGPAGSRILTLGPIDGQAITLAPGTSAVVGDKEYDFIGPRAFAGITIRRDPGSSFIWVATGLLLVGLVFTFYTPRRRLWGKVVGQVASFRGLGGRAATIEIEILQAGRASSRREAPTPRIL